MIHFLFFYNYSDGQIPFELIKDDPDQTQLIGGLLSAISSFWRELFKDKKISLIGGGNKAISFIEIFPDLKIDLVIIYDLCNHAVIYEIGCLIKNIVTPEKKLFFPPTMVKDKFYDLKDKCNEIVKQYIQIKAFYQDPYRDVIEIEDIKIIIFE